MLQEAMQLLIVLHSRPNQNDADFGLIQAISSYVELHIRAATQQLEAELLKEGLIDDDFTGSTPTRR